MKKAKADTVDKCPGKSDDEGKRWQEVEQMPPAPLEVKGSAIRIDGIAAELINKIDGLIIDEVVFRKGDYTLSVRPTTGTVSASDVRRKSDELAAMPPSLTPAVSPSSQPQVAPVAAPKVEEAAYKKTINAPLVGTFYSAPAPGKPMFVNEGDIVEKGAKVCIVEAMKLFNEISAPTRCRIIKILVTEGTAVDKDQPLFAIEEL
jgi:acetyl-CoA carboxylase biotin carboxyl carrier protein